MKEWHSPDIFRDDRETGEQEGNKPLYHMDAEDLAVSGVPIGSAPIGGIVGGVPLGGAAVHLATSIGGEKPDSSVTLPKQHVYEAEGPEEPSGRKDVDSGQEKYLVRQLDRWIASMERLQLAEYMRYVNNRKRMIGVNLLGGLAKGLGSAVGFTILGAIVVLILQSLARRNLPLIGDTLAQIVSIVQMRLK